jgi:FtsX-like permease family
MNTSSTARGMVLGSLFARRSRSATRFLATIVGAVLALALSGLFGLVNFVGHISDQLGVQQFGEPLTEGCVEGDFRFDYYRLDQYRNIQLAARCATPPTPPGLDKFPQPGEVFLSPALDKLRKTDSGMAVRFPRADGLISPSGLTSSNELRSITGIESSNVAAPVGRTTFDEFGDDGGAYLGSALRFDQGSLVATGLLFTLPSSVYLIAACTRLNARTRERQLGLLSVMGLDSSSIRRTLTTEATLTTGTGAIIGAVIAAGVFPRLTPTFVAWKAFPGDFVPSWANLVVVVIFITVAAIVAASLAARSLNRRNERNRARSAGRSRARTRWSHIWRWLLLAAGIVASVVTTWWDTDDAVYGALGGRVLSFVALIVVTPLVCQALGRRLANSDSSLNALVGARLRCPSGTLTRALATVAAGLFLFSVGATIVDTLGADPTTIEQSYSQDGFSVVQVSQFNDANRQLLENYEVLTAFEPANPDEKRTITGMCKTFAKVVNVQPNCEHRTFYVTPPGYPADPQMQNVPRVVMNTPRSHLVERAVVTVSVTDFPTDLPEKPIDNFDRYNLLIPLPIIEAQELYNQLIGNDPTVNVLIAGAASVGGARELNSILDVFGWGSAFVVTIALLGATVSLTALLYDRQSGNNYLQILGVTRTQIAKTALTEVAAASGVTLTLAAFMSWLWAVSYNASSTNEPVSITALALPFIAALIILLGFGAAMIAATMRNTNSNLIAERDRLASADDIFITAT